MTIYTVVRDVCAAVGVMMPNSVFANLDTNRTMQEMVSLANEMAQRIAYDTRDWTELLATVTVSGGGGGSEGGGGGDGGGDSGGGARTTAPTTDFLLPNNFKRLLLGSEVWRSTSTQQPMRFVNDPNEWMRRRVSGEENPGGEWIIYGGSIHIRPALTFDVSAWFAYQDKNCVRLASGGFGDQFMADGDSFRLDERLLKLGMVWQWKANKGSPYAEDMGSYSDALANAMGHDQPAPILMDRPGKAGGRWDAGQHW
jgi:hypothetical protein